MRAPFNTRVESTKGPWEWSAGIRTLKITCVIADAKRSPLQLFPFSSNKQLVGFTRTLGVCARWALKQHRSWLHKDFDIRKSEVRGEAPSCGFITPFLSSRQLTVIKPSASSSLQHSLLGRGPLAHCCRRQLWVDSAPAQLSQVSGFPRTLTSAPYHSSQRGPIQRFASCANRPLATENHVGRLGEPCGRE